MIKKKLGVSACKLVMKVLWHGLLSTTVSWLLGYVFETNMNLDLVLEISPRFCEDIIFSWLC